MYCYFYLPLNPEYGVNAQVKLRVTELNKPSIFQDIDYMGTLLTSLIFKNYNKGLIQFKIDKDKADISTENNCKLLSANLYSSSGMYIKSQFYEDENTHISFDISNIPQGIYIIEAKSLKGTSKIMFYK